mgnify:CR=1 FL=1
MTTLRSSGAVRQALARQAAGEKPGALALAARDKARHDAPAGLVPVEKFLGGQGLVASEIGAQQRGRAKGAEADVESKIDQRVELSLQHVALSLAQRIGVS